MRAIVVYPISTDFSGNSGIIAKMHQQVSGFQALGFDTTLVHNSIRGVVINGSSAHKYLFGAASLNHYVLFWERVVDLVQTVGIDLVYVRYPGASPMFLRFLQRCRQSSPTAKIVLEIATYPFRAEMRSLAQRLILLSDDVFSVFLKHYVDRVVTFYGQDSIYGIPCHKADNGIDPAAHPVKLPSVADGILRIIAVANVADWHGYDRVIRGLAQLSQQDAQSVEFHLVGDGPAVGELKRLTAELRLTRLVKFHGHQNRESLDGLFDKCDIGIDAIGCHRKGLATVSSLKAREYCARGMPFVNTGTDTGFPLGWPYLHVVPSTNAAIDISRIVAFAKENEHAKVVRPMREYARVNLSWETQLAGLMPAAADC